MKVTDKTYLIKTYQVTGGKNSLKSVCENLQCIKANWDNLKRYVHNIAKSRENDDFRIDVENVQTDLVYRVIRDKDVITMTKLGTVRETLDDMLDVVVLNSTGNPEFKEVERQSYSIDAADAHIPEIPAYYADADKLLYETALRSDYNKQKA